MLVTRSFREDDDLGFLQGSLMAGVSPEILFIAKLLFNWLATVAIALLVLAGIAILFNMNLAAALPSLLGLIALTSVGFAALGTFFAAMFFRTKLQYLLIPITFYPLIMPLIVPAISATEQAFQQQPMGGLYFLFGFNLLFLAVTYMLFAFLVES